MPIHHGLPQIRISDFDILKKPVDRATAVAANATADWDVGVKALGDTIPGYRYSATFLTSLRTNLHLSASSPTSPSSSIPSTPTTPAFSQIPSVPSAWSKPSVWTYSLPESHTTSTISHPTLSVFHQEKAFPASIQSRRQDSPPRLTFTLVPSTDISTRECAHRLIADSVAQQRQLAFRSLLFHPFVLLLFSTFLALGSRVLHTATLLLTASFVITAAILIAHHLTYPYIQYAEDIDRFWLGLPPPSISSTQTNGDTSNHSSTSNSSPSITTNAIPSQKSDEALVLTAHLQVPDKNNKPGNDSNSKEPVAALILRIPKRERRGYVRAWTVQHKHRNKGVGTALLEEAVRVVHARVGGSGARGAVVEFEDRHAHSQRIPYPPLLLSSLALAHSLPSPLSWLIVTRDCDVDALLDRRDERARSALKDAVKRYRVGERGGYGAGVFGSGGGVGGGGNANSVAGGERERDRERGRGRGGRGR